MREKEPEFKDGRNVEPLEKTMTIKMPKKSDTKPNKVKEEVKDDA